MADYIMNYLNIGSDSFEVADATARADTSELKQDLTNLQNTMVTDTASGSIASFSDGADGVPMESLIVNIEPSQPNDYDSVWPAGGGKNLFENTASTRTVNGITFTVNDDGSVTVNGTATSNAVLLLSTYASENLTEGTSYILSGCPSGGGSATYRIYISDGTNYTYADDGSGSTFTASSDVIAGCSAYLRISSGQTVSNLTFYPMICLSSATDPTVFAPYENVCPITGHTDVTVTRTGKNWLNITDEPSFDIVTYIEDDEGNVIGLYVNGTISESSTISLNKTVSVIEGQTYTLSCTGLVSGMVIGARDVVSSANINDSTTEADFVASDSTCRIILNLSVGTYDTELYPMIRIATDTDSTFEPYETAETVTTQLGQTVYGGTLDVVSGVLTIDRIYEVFDGSDDELWYTYSDTGFRVPKQSGAIASSGEGICNIAPTVTSASSYGVMFSSSANYIYFFQSVSTWGVSTVSDLRTWLASNNVVVCYKTDNLTTVQLTPIEVASLLGDNNVFSSAGSVSVTYTADLKKYIAKVVANA